MIKRILPAILSMTLLHGCSQTPHERFLKNFKIADSNTIVKFSSLANETNPMTKDEALEFVYHNDTTRLFCLQRVINMETEKLIGIDTSIYFPDKSLLVKKVDYLIVCNSRYQCQDPNQFLFKFIDLKIWDKNFNLMDSLTVYKGTDYDYELTGLLNPLTSKVFLVGHLNDVLRNDAAVFEITERLKFKKIREVKNVKTNDNLDRVLDDLGWRSYFSDTQK